MCEILIKIVNATHPDPVIEAADCYKRGDIIYVAEDGYPWSRMESKQAWLAEGNLAATWHNRTAILKIPGVTVAKARALMTDDAPSDVRRARRLWRLAIASVPQVVKDAVQADGEYTTTVAAIRTYLRNKISNAEYTGF